MLSTQSDKQVRLCLSHVWVSVFSSWTQNAQEKREARNLGGLGMVTLPPH